MYSSKSVISSVLGGKSFDDIWNSMVSSFEKMGTAMNMFEKENTYVVELLVPGVSKDEIQIKTKNDNLVVEKTGVSEKDMKGLIHREFFTGKVTREIMFPEPVDLKTATAKLENGVLTITVKKLGKDAAPGTIKID